MENRRICTFSIAHTDISIFPFNNAQRTIRVFVPNNLSGDGVQIKFSNYYSEEPVWVANASIALCSEKDVVILNTIAPLTVNGDTSFAIVPQRDIFSDEIPLQVQPGQWIAISLYYKQTQKVTSGNFVGNFAERSQKGDYCNAEKMPCPHLWTRLSHGLMPWDASSAITTLSSVLVLQNKTLPAPRVVAVLADSIAQQGTWTTPFTARLYKAYPGEISFCNLGIGGNRLLYDSPALTQQSYGIAGEKRFIHDLLPVEGLTHVIFALGTNDIGLPGKDGAPDEDMITAQQYAQAVQKIVQALKLQKLKVYGATLLPRNIGGNYTGQKEAVRIEINDWIRNSNTFDTVLDFDQYIGTDENGEIKKELYLPDGLHPSLAGGRHIAAQIDLELFK